MVNNFKYCRAPNNYDREEFEIYVIENWKVL